MLIDSKIHLKTEPNISWQSLLLNNHHSIFKPARLSTIWDDPSLKHRSATLLMLPQGHLADTPQVGGPSQAAGVVCLSLQPVVVLQILWTDKEVELVPDQLWHLSWPVLAKQTYKDAVLPFFIYYMTSSVKTVNLKPHKVSTSCDFHSRVVPFPPTAALKTFAHPENLTFIRHSANLNGNQIIVFV